MKINALSKGMSGIDLVSNQGPCFETTYCLEEARWLSGSRLSGLVSGRSWESMPRIDAPTVPFGEALILITKSLGEDLKSLVP